MASLKESLSKGITTINVKTSSFMEESKCKTYISTLEKEIQILKQNIGEIVYAKSVAGESYEEEVTKIIEQIQSKYAEIEQQKATIEQLAVQEKQILGNQSATVNIKYCAKCGAQNAANYKFCSKCGTPLN
ncbi:MAG: zinc ribbon domain-containing protein [Roseburia sp.]|nr:zinc ribbon domain-containing protein [Roseburia sp.]HCI25541.1 hypothetical protein [Lachnospiraceae bacterium]